jgi:type I restriction enzyme S subunit
MSDLIPDGWSFEPLGEYVSDSVAGEWGKEALGNEDDIPVLRATNFSQSGIIDYRKLAIRNIEEKKRIKKSLVKGDILVEKSGGSPTQPVGRVIYFDNDKPFLYSNFTQKLSPKDNVDSKFLFYKLYFEYQKGVVLKFQQQTTGIINFQLAEYLLFKSAFPPLPEQQKIAAILTSVDDVIEKTQAQIDKLKDLKTGMMQELLTHGVGVDGKPHTEFKDSPVGRIPKGWDVKNVSELQDPEKYSCVGGPFGSDLTSKDYVENAGVPVIRGGNLHLSFEKFRDNNFVFVSEEKANSLVRNMAYPGELIFTQRGTMGQVGLIPKVSKFSRYVVSQSQMKLKINESLARREYLYQYFLSDVFKRQLDLETIATGLPHINLGILKSFNIPLPSLEEQNKIEQLLLSIDHRCLLQIHKKQKYISLKKALMQDLLTGKVRVKVDS